jgi:hypothetical protein
VRSNTAGWFLGLLLWMPVHAVNAVVFDGSTTRTFEIDRAFAAIAQVLYDGAGIATGSTATARLTGTLMLGPRPGPAHPSRPEGDVGLDGTAQITIEDLLDFNLSLTVPVDRDGALATFPLTPALGAFDLIAGSLTTDGMNLVLDASGIPAGVPLVQVTRDRFPMPLVLPPSPAFPNGQRYGDDVSDQLLLQLVAGSINVLSAALPEGFSAPAAAIGFGPITAGNAVQLASVRAVPVPGGIVLAPLALGIVLAARRRA